MSVPTNNRGNQLHHQHHHPMQQHLHHQQMDHNAAAAMALAQHDFSNPNVMGHHDDETQYHRNVMNVAALHQQQQMQQIPQHHLQPHHHMQPHHQLQQHHQLQHHPMQHQQMQPHHQMHQQMQPLHQQIQPPPHQQHPMGMPANALDYETGGYLVSRHGEGDIIKTFSLKQELVKYVKTVLNEEEQCKIVINSSKPKAVYFQCERSGLFRTTVKDATKRQRVAYTKRSKCGYRLVANLYPPEKDKAKKTKKEANEFDGYDDDKKDGEMWILRMIHPAHNHAPEPNFAMIGGKKKRAKYTRTLVEKPLHRSQNPLTASAAAAAVGYQQDLLDHHNLLAHQFQHLQHQHQQQLHPHMQHPQHHQHHGHHDETHPSVQDVAVIAAMEAAPSGAAMRNPPVDPSIDPSVDPNVDPSVQQHDHAHGHVH